MNTLKNFKNKFLTENVAVIFLIASIILLTLSICRHDLLSLIYDDSVDNLTGGIVACIISVANTILLYLTLSSQNDGLANEKLARKQERFETTFFNLLELQNMLSGEIEVIYGIIDNNACVSSANVKGTPFFSFATKEIEMIKKSLKSKTAIAYDDEQVTYELAAFEYQWDRKDPTGVMGMQRNNEWIALREDIKIRYYNLVYNISTTDKQRYLTDETLPYNLFYKKWYSSYERYVRNLYLILQFICEEVSTRDYLIVKYTRFLQAQMNMAELEFIKIHAQSFPAFREMFDKTHLTEIITNNKA